MMNREQALALLQKYNKEPFHIRHALTVEQVMRWYAKDQGFEDEQDFWGLVGLLHDIGKWKEYTAGIDHAAFGSRLAREILPRAFFNQVESDIICQAIYEHRNINRDMSFLGERLHRADNLSRFCQECDCRDTCPKVAHKESSVSSFEY